MSDIIHISKLTFFARHGVFDEERKLGQKFMLSLEIKVDLSGVGQKDELTAGICYKDIIETSLEFCTVNIFKTIEGLAEHLAQKLLIKFSKIESVQLTIEKPSAAIDAIFENIAVVISRDRETMMPLSTDADFVRLKKEYHLEPS
ncbi:MAG: dihydroneopterin aldolase [Pseudomonadota bacterium]